MAGARRLPRGGPRAPVVCSIGGAIAPEAAKEEPGGAEGRAAAEELRGARAIEPQDAAVWTTARGGAGEHVRARVDIRPIPERCLLASAAGSAIRPRQEDARRGDRRRHVELG